MSRKPKAKKKGIVAKTLKRLTKPVAKASGKKRKSEAQYYYTQHPFF